MKNKFLYFLLMLGLSATLTLTACGSSSDGSAGAAGAAGAAGTDATALPPDDTYFSVVITDNSHWHMGDNLVFADFVAEGGTAATPVTGTTNDWVIAKHVNDLSSNLIIDGDITDWGTDVTTVKGLPVFGYSNTSGTAYSARYATFDSAADGGDVDISARDMSVGIAYDDAYIYMVVSWVDANKSDQGRQRYEFDGTDWAKSTNVLYNDEDRMFVVWPIVDAESNYVAGGSGCLNYCHPAPALSGELTGAADADRDEYWHMGTNTTGDRVDAWHWKAVRNDGIGFLEDKHWQTDTYTSGEPDNGRKADGGRGPNASIGQASTTPKGPNLVNYAGPSGTYADLLEFDAVPYESAVAAGYAAADGDISPRYLLRQPSGSIADVETVSSYDADTTTWTVEMRRLRLTGDPGDDHQFTGGGTDATAPTAVADVTVTGTAATGATTYTSKGCSTCHGAAGAGTAGTFPAIAQIAYGMVYSSVANGSGAGTMAGQSALTAQESADIAAWLQTQ